MLQSLNCHLLLILLLLLLLGVLWKESENSSPLMSISIYPLPLPSLALLMIHSPNKRWQYFFQRPVSLRNCNTFLVSLWDRSQIWNEYATKIKMRHIRNGNTRPAATTHRLSRCSWTSPARMANGPFNRTEGVINEHLECPRLVATASD